MQPVESAQGFTPESFYVKGHDGTRLAMFIYGGADAALPRPVIWNYNRYNRAALSRQVIQSWGARFPALQKVLAASKSAPEGGGGLLLTGPLADLVRGGYLVALVDIRGTGSSFGVQTAPFSEDEALDAGAVLEWLAEQPFCNGKIGMVGRSYMGANQHVVAAAAAGRLTAIMPEMAPFDLYSTVYRGGIFRRDFATSWFSDIDRRDKVDSGAEVDGAEGADLLSRARAEHGANRDLYAMFSQLPYRDSIDQATGTRPYQANSPGHDGTRFREPNVPVHHIAGWSDPFVKDALLWFANIRSPKRLTIGPWSHSGSAGIDLGKQYRRWFDHWMCGAENGVMEGPAIWYYMIGAATGDRWRSTDQWPPQGFHPEPLFLTGGSSGTVESVNDGRLVTEPGGEGEERDEYQVDYSASSGKSTQWTNVYGGPFGYGDMSQNDRRCLTYTSGHLQRPLEMTGHPVAHLWVSSTAADGDFFVYLEQVAPDGSAAYVTEGSLRASHRQPAEPPHEYLGLPYQRSHEADVSSIDEEPVELVFDLSPISWKFPEGARIRVTIACTDADNAPAPVLTPPPVVSIHRSSRLSSFVVLPVRDEICLRVTP